MAHSLTNLLYHIVFAVKERRPCLAGAVCARTHRYLGGTVRQLGGVAIEVGGVADHVHLLVRLHQDTSVSAIVRDIKANSSKWLKQHLSGFAWQTGYAAFTVSPSQMARVRDYIRNQEAHHQKVSFEDEFIRLLDAHGITYDRAFLWR